LGVRADQTPCIVFWTSLDEERIVTVPVGHLRNDRELSEAFKNLSGSISAALNEPDSDILGALERAVPEFLTSSTSRSVGSLVRAFLHENTPPLRDRLTLEDIDSFALAHDVSRQEVAMYLSRLGYLDVSEETVQLAIEAILGASWHKKDWGGEINDLYSSDILVAGVRTPTAFLLKGHGLRRAELRIADCGKNGDQLLRLFTSPASLFVVQFVGNVSEAVIADVQGKVAQLRAVGRPAWFLIIDGVDTARLLYAYGYLPEDGEAKDN
jgi:hypothetical protein